MRLFRPSRALGLEGTSVILVIITVIVITVVLVIVIIVIIVIVVIVVLVIVIIKLVADKWGQHHNGAAAKVINFDRFGKKVSPGTFGKIQVG